MQIENYEYLAKQFSYPRRNYLLTGRDVKNYYESYITKDVMEKYDLDEYQLAAAIIFDHMFGHYDFAYRPRYSYKRLRFPYHQCHGCGINKFIPDYEWILKESNLELFDVIVALFRHYGIRFPHLESELEYDPTDEYYYNGRYIRCFSNLPKNTDYSEIRNLYNLLVEMIRELTDC